MHEDKKSYIKINYNAVSFMIERNICVACVYYINENDSNLFLTKRAVYNNQDIPVFNFSKIIESSIKTQNTMIFPVALIINLQSFSTTTKQELIEYFQKSNIMFNTDYIALTLSKEITISKILENEKKNLASSVATLYANLGIEYISFTSDTSVNFFISLENLLLHTIRKAD